MTSPDPRRLALFIGILGASVIVLLVAARLADVNPIALAPAYMFSPMIAGLIVCVHHDTPLSNVGFRLGRPRWLVLAAIVALPLVGLTLGLAVALPGVGFDPTVDPVPRLDIPPGMIGVLVTFAPVLAAAFLHGVFNGSAGLVIAYAVTDTAVLEELVASPVGLAGILTFSLAAVGIAYRGTPAN